MERKSEATVDDLAQAPENGKAELVDLGHRMMMNLAAVTAGVDRPLGTADETRRLYAYLRTFIEGATLGHYTGDREAKSAEVAASLSQFDTEFVAPSEECAGGGAQSARANE